MGFCFSSSGKLEVAFRTIFIEAFILGVISFLVISLVYGIFREYYYECAIITIVWLVIIINGILLGRHYYLKMKQR
jgi:hypothetical protein